MDNRQKNFFQVWFQAIRFPSLTGSLIPIMLGQAFAILDRAFNGKHFLLALIGGMLMQAGANLFNDYFDFKSGADQADSLTANRVIRQGLLTPRQVYRGGMFLFGLAFLIGIYFFTTVGSGILWLGLTGLVLGYAYSGGTYPLAYRALGELVVFYAMGPLVVLGTYFVQVGMFRSSVFLGSIPVGLMAAAVLHANNLRDREQDLRVGKRTLANLLSEQKARRLLFNIVSGTYLFQLGLVATGIVPWLSSLTLLTLPLAYILLRKAEQSRTPLELNISVGYAVLLHLLYGIAYTLGLYFSSLLI